MASSEKIEKTASAKIEKQFAKSLKKAGWHTYLHEETGRVVTNAYKNERLKIQRISELPCEVVEGEGIDSCARIGPKLKP